MRTFLVEGDKTFKIDIPDDAKITYGPWAPPKKDRERGFADTEGNKRGTLRIYQADGKSIIACFAGVTNFRDLSVVIYSEQVAKEEGASMNLERRQLKQIFPLWMISMRNLMSSPKA